MSCGHNVKLASCYVSREKKKFSKTQIQETNLRANTLVRKQRSVWKLFQFVASESSFFVGQTFWSSLSFFVV
ncbi:hypothetical protein GLOIN_2v859372 [Rhizophagus irregularis DAOM 181602=DAOM 197198]|nr:hypothetical protein GLOIN_2v859372 [Rhizophagus irregularis DAOM 181602=DAOM 197198]